MATDIVRMSNNLWNTFIGGIKITEFLAMFLHMLLTLCRQRDVFTRIVVQIKSFNDFWRQVPYCFHASIVPYLIHIKAFPTVEVSKNSSLLPSSSFDLCFLESSLFVANPEEKRCTDSHCYQIDWQGVAIKCRNFNHISKIVRAD